MHTNQFGRREIADDDLVDGDLPEPESRYFGVIDEFALSCDGYARRADDCADFADQAIGRFRHEGILPESISHLRTCLFFEQRRWRAAEEEPNSEAMLYIHALVESIRRKVRDAG